MTNAYLGKLLIGAAALSTLIVPIFVDGYLFAKAHMQNPRWLPHAKLHTSMSFSGAIGLGLGTLWLLWVKPAADLDSMAIAAFLASIFWVGLIASRLWPNTSYTFSQDPDVYLAPPRVAGIPLPENVLASITTIVLAWLGYAILAS